MNISLPGRHGLGKTLTNLSKGGRPSPKTWANTILAKVPANSRGHIVAAIGEFAGTIFFLFFAFAGTQVANISSNTNTGSQITTTVEQKNPAQLLYISLSFGFSLAVNAWVFFRISGGLFNPAVTFGMWLIGSITVARAILLSVVQCLGAIVAAALVKALFSGGLNVSTTLSATTSVVQGFFIEVILTAQLVFTIFMLAAEKHAGTFIAPVGIGLALFIAELTGKSPLVLYSLEDGMLTEIGVFWTGGSLNPARSLGPSVVVKSFPSYHWIYWIAPCAGSLLAAALYKLVKSLEYENITPDPEADTLTRAVAPDGSSSEPPRSDPITNSSDRSDDTYVAAERKAS
ncbi:Aquaporin-2 [Lachnellula hyalina]|uniref:Aquaporin-2 n=1 Tax=Lachnellula hyalina TaxID=1316788 RepID=A0A8H8QZP6_9HELO|nr:Aquaporin-2 [Lachnellula hyalina]TVY25728.1 Aquaporin-2 [Lachnellula hyalina]